MRRRELKKLSVILLLVILCGCNLNSKGSVSNSANTTSSSMTVLSTPTPIIQSITPVYSSTPIPTQTPELPVLPSGAVKLKDKVVSSNKIDYDNDGIKETIQIVLKNGYFTEDKEQWSGSGPKWVGLFTIDVLKAKKKVSSQSLSKLVGSEETIFLYSPEFELAFGDYNSDKQPDFTITQYFSTNGSEIYLFTVSMDGQIQKLNIENRYAFFQSPHLINNSIPLEFSKNQIKFWYYDNTQGAYFTDYYGWDAHTKLFIRLNQEKAY